MGKRKHDSDSYEYIAKKIKRLERKLQRTRRKRSDSISTSSSRNSPSDKEDEATMAEVGETYYHANDDVISEVEQTEPVNEPAPSTSSAQPVYEGSIEEIPKIVELDSELLQILGEDPSAVKEYGKDIQTDLAVRLQHVATQGITNEAKKELEEKYLPPGNCTLIGAPSLNPEIKAALSEPVIKRDKSIELKQKHLGSAISSVGEALTLLLKSENKDMSVIKLLMDASRILCNCQNMDSVTRRNFILHNLKKDMKDQLLKTKIDKFLFGADLTESIKIARSISKSGAELKAQTPSSSRTPSSKFNQLPGPSSQIKPQRSNLNWKGPPPSRRPKGAPRTRDPAPRTQPASYSRPSYRPPPTTNRGRR